MTSLRDRSRQGVVRRARALRAGRAAGVLLAAVALAGCAAGGGATGQGPSSSPRADLAAKAEVAARNLGTGPDRPGTHRGPRARAGDRPVEDRAGSGRSGPARPGPGRGGSVAGDGASGSSPPDASSGRTDAATWSELLTVHDPVADQGAAPDYADVEAMTLADDGRRLQVTVRLDAVVPGRLAAREVQGVGVDLFREDLQESDYQLFLDGGGHGWRAFLQTPRGFVRYPGTVGVSGAVLSMTVPWDALGGRRGGEVSGFVDWSDGAGRSGSDLVERGPLRLP